MKKFTKWMVLLAAAVCAIFSSSTISGQGLVSGHIATPLGADLVKAPVDITYGNNTTRVYTDSLGHYSFFVPENVPVSIVPAPNGIPGGPLNGVDWNDSLLIRMQILGEVAFTSPYQYIAADLNYSASITTFDLVLLARILNMVETFQNDIEWRFIRADYTFPNPSNPFNPPFETLHLLDSIQGNVSNLDYVAIKMGDVNFSALTLANGGAFLSGHVVWDANTNCIADSAETPLLNWLIKAENQDTNLVYHTSSLSNGTYSLILPPGNYRAILTPLSSYWAPCADTLTDLVIQSGVDVAADFPVQVLQECPQAWVDMSIPFIRRCFNNTYRVQYGNLGTTVLENATVEVILDPAYTFVSATLPLVSQNGNSLVFDAGDIPPAWTGSFQVVFYLSCESPLGSTHCSSATISPNTPCEPLAGWDGSVLQIQADCEGDTSVLFTVTNIGQDMAMAADYIILEDIVIQMQAAGALQLPGGDTQTFTLPANGSTWRMEVEQTPGNPGGNIVSTALEGCGENSNGNSSQGVINLFPLNDEAMWNDRDCQQNIGAYDPNDKTGFPLGIDEAHWVPRDQRMEYRIRFQNTGTDTAFNVVIRDTISALLDLSTLQVGAASHSFNYKVASPNILEFYFPNIMLPDSNVNEPGSHGFVKFSISPVRNLPDGTVINNSAAIYFDFNDPIITNTTLHTFGENYLAVATHEPQSGHVQVKLWPNPAHERAQVITDGAILSTGTFRLLDLQGKTLREQRFDTPEFSVPVSGLVPGMYVYQLVGDSGAVMGSGKVVIGVK